MYIIDIYIFQMIILLFYYNYLILKKYKIDVTLYLWFIILKPFLQIANADKVLIFITNVSKSLLHLNLSNLLFLL